MSHYTKTTNGALAIPSNQVNSLINVWMIMGGTYEHNIINYITVAFYDVINQPDKLIDLLTMILRLRDFRNGGHGRRLESYIALLTILPLINDNNITKIMLELYACHYGSWNDLKKIIKILLNSNKYSPDFINLTVDIIYKMWANVIKSNIMTCETAGAWKYFPNENDSNIEIRIAIAKLLFPTITQDLIFNGKEVNDTTCLKNKWHRLLKSIRINLRPNRNKIQMVEFKLCSNNADKINPSQVPGLARKFLGRALENLASLKSKQGNVQRTDNPKRIICAENFVNHAKTAIEARYQHKQKIDALQVQLNNNELSSKEKNEIINQIEIAETEFEKNALKVHGGNTVYIHDLIKQYNYTLKKNEMIEAQYCSILATMKILKEYNVLVVPDTSGSMNGLPSFVAQGLTSIFAASLPLPLRHKCIAFSSYPKVFDLSNINDGNPSLIDYIKYFKDNQIIENTNIKSTIDLIYKMMQGQSFKLDMILFITDTQFDHITTDSSFTAGEYCKEKLPDTLIGFWNVNGQYLDSLPAQPSENGIVMISGFNPKMIESIIDTVKNVSQMKIEEIQDIYIQLEEAKQHEIEAQQYEIELNTNKLIADFCASKFSFPLKKKLSNINCGIFSQYNFVETDININSDINIKSDVKSTETFVELVVEPDDSDDENN